MAIAIVQIYVIVIAFVYSDQNKCHLAGASSQESKAENSRRLVSSASSLADPGEGSGRPGSPIMFRPNWGSKGRKKIFFEAKFTLCRIAFAPAWKSYQIGLLYGWRKLTKAYSGTLSRPNSQLEIMFKFPYLASTRLNSHYLAQTRGELRSQSRPSLHSPVWKHYVAKLNIAGENIRLFPRFSSLFAAGDVSRGGTSATRQQKFHTDDISSQC